MPECARANVYYTIAILVLGLGVSGYVSPVLSAQDEVLPEHQRPAVLQAILMNTHQHFDYQPDTRHHWIGTRNNRGITQGNCTVFARLVQQSLLKNGFLPRFVNVDLRSPRPAQDPRHVVTVVADPTGHEWVLDNRYPFIYHADQIPTRYHRVNTTRFTGMQRRTWSAVASTIGAKNKP